MIIQNRLGSKLATVSSRYKDTNQKDQAHAFSVL